MNLLNLDMGNIPFLLFFYLHTQKTIECHILQESLIPCFKILNSVRKAESVWTETYFFIMFYGYWQGSQYFSPRTFTQFSTKNVSIHKEYLYISVSTQKEYLSNESCVQKVNSKWSFQVIVTRIIGISVKQNISMFCPEVTWSRFYIV